MNKIWLSRIALLKGSGGKAEENGTICAKARENGMRINKSSKLEMLVSQMQPH